jgi:hypothetical protein
VVAQPIDLKPGDHFRYGTYFDIRVQELADGIYPFVRTGPATMTLPWRVDAAGKLEVCLLQQEF